MREIKFRAWDGEAISFPLTMGDIIGGHLDWDDDNPPTLMQYTGLKDKNGNEIYEGDILVYRKLVKEFSFKDKGGHYHTKERKNPKEELHYWEVFWNERRGWRTRRGDGTNSLWKVVKNHEIIGNIYENSELLKTV